nr:MAG TPA: hypothetical protein [Bacteriophage sp.]
MIMRSHTYSKITAAVIPGAFDIPPTQADETASNPSIKPSLSPEKTYDIYDSQVSIVTRPNITLDYKIKYIP